MKKLISVLLAFCMLLSFSPAVFAASVKGDIDGDGKVNSSDALIVLQYSIGQKKTIDKTKADLNGDGLINSGDALIILQICVGIIFVVPTGTEGIVNLYNSALKKAYYSESLTLDYTRYDKGTTENLTQNTKKNYNDDSSEKAVFKNGINTYSDIEIEFYGPKCEIDPKWVTSAVVSEVSGGYKIVIKLKEEKTNAFDYPVYTAPAFGFAYVEDEITSGTTRYTGTVFTLELNKNGSAKSVETSMPYVVDYVQTVSGKSCNMRDTGTVYFYSKLVY